MLITLTPLQYLKSLDKRSMQFLLLWMGISLLFHILASVYSIGFQFFDEHFQIFEFAGLKLGKTTEAILPWEFREHVRPTLQPTFAYYYIKLFGLEDPFFIAFAGRFISGVLGWFGSFFFLLCAIQWIQSAALKRFLIVLTSILWFLPFVHVRFSSESWSGSFFFIGLAILLISQVPKIKASGSREVMYLCMAGFLLGLSYVFRLQSAIMFPGVFLWGLLIARIRFPKLVIMGIALLAAVGLGVLCDRWFYGEWVNTAFIYYKKNIVEGVASSFGVSPWYYYFTETYKKGLAPFSLLMIIGVVVAFIRYPKNVLTWAIIPFIIIHSMIAHKELRFLFPIVNAIPVLVVLAVNGIGREYWRQVPVWLQKSGKWLLVIYFIANSIYLFGASFQPAEQSFGVYRHINTYYKNKEIAIVGQGYDPYYRLAQLYMKFYMFPNYRTYKIDSASELKTLVKNSEVPVLYFSDIKEFNAPPILDSLQMPYKPEYYTMPKWFEKVNFNNWISRSPNYGLYNLRPDLMEGNPKLKENIGSF